ncbi:MAG: hypothetical protein ACR2NL_07265, partial [Acidimicrobiia bacterium]
MVDDLRRLPMVCGVVIALVVAGCSSPDGDISVQGITTLSPTTEGPPPTTAPPSTVGTTTTPPTITSPSTTSSTVPTPQPAEPYEPASSDVLRDRKRLGGQFAQAVLTYDADTT